MAKSRKKAARDGGTAVEEPPTNGETLTETDAANAEQAATLDAAVAAVAEKQRKAEAFDKIAAMNKDVAKAAREAHAASENAKAKKKAWEARVAELQSAIVAAEEPPPMPLFDAKPGTNGEYHPADDSWRAETLAEALKDVSEAVIAKLHAANLHTVGELADFTAADGGRKRITDVPGIGGATAEKIDAALEAFWKRRKEEDAKAAELVASVVPGEDDEE